MTPLPGLNTHSIIKPALKLLSTHPSLLTPYYIPDAIDLLTLLLKLAIHENIDVRDIASDCLQSVLSDLAGSLDPAKQTHKNTFLSIISKFQEILEDPSRANVLVLSTIRAIGVFSKAISVFMGDEELMKYLERLIQVAEMKVMAEFLDDDDPSNQTDARNFKIILKKQKQLISYIESYSYVISNLV